MNRGQRSRQIFRKVTIPALIIINTIRFNTTLKNIIYYLILYTKILKNIHINRYVNIYTKKVNQIYDLVYALLYILACHRIGRIVFVSPGVKIRNSSLNYLYC